MDTVVVNPYSIKVLKTYLSRYNPSDINVNQNTINTVTIP